MIVRRIPIYDATDVMRWADGGEFCQPDITMIEVEPYSDNRVKIRVGSVCKIVDGISLASAIHEVLTLARRA